MKFTWVTPKILEIRFQKSYDLCNNTYLFSHHYEDPEWSGKVFTRLELDEFYEIKYGDAHFWKKKWAGSNLPDAAFERFIAGDFIGLNDFEMDLIQKVRGIYKPFYVIMTSEESLYARDHEIAHAIWYTNSEYKSKAQEIVDHYKRIGQIDAAIYDLRKAGYSDKVMDDELHVFCGIYYDHYFHKLATPTPKEMVKQLVELFNAYKP